jgi:hypothetical protein
VASFYGIAGINEKRTLKIRNIIILVLIFAVLGGVYYGVSRPKPVTPPTPKEYVWLIEQDEINHVTISLPRENPVSSQSFVRITQGDTFPWYFDDANHSPVDTSRWGGGIPLLLSGPGADRVISENTSPEKLTEYGLTNPKMTIKLDLTDNVTMQILVGDRTPDGSNYYVKDPDSNAVATVDYTWYDVLEKIVKEPPYAKTK